jgi:hypothetical protein
MGWFGGEVDLGLEEAGFRVALCVVAPVISINGKARTICSWKFELASPLAENAAARTTG